MRVLSQWGGLGYSCKGHCTGMPKAGRTLPQSPGAVGARPILLAASGALLDLFSGFQLLCEHPGYLEPRH